MRHGNTGSSFRSQTDSSLSSWRVNFGQTISGFSLEPERVQEMLERHYAGSNFVHVQPLKTPAEMTATKLSCNDLRDTNQMEIFVFGDAEQILLCSRLDNLGKGASGAAVQCMNIMLGLDETVGLL